MEVKTGFDEVSVEGLAVGKRSEPTAGFEERRKGEAVGTEGGRVKLRV